MARIFSEDIRFSLKEDAVEGTLFGLFRFSLPRRELERFGEVEGQDGTLVFPRAKQERVDRRFPQLLRRAFRGLTNTLTDNPALYIDRGSGIPLIGSLAFGIVDKGSGMMEVKPLTSCNTSCVFCSVDEGFDSRKIRDVVIEPGYLADETRRILDLKATGMHLYINPQGEPLLYKPLPRLLRALKAHPGCERISIITNAKLLTPKNAQELAEAGADCFHISLHTLDEERGKELMHDPSYSVRRILVYIEEAQRHAEVLLSPVWLPGVNDADIDALIAFARKKRWPIMIQNFLRNPRGRNPVKEAPFTEFFRRLEALEKKYGVSLVMSGEIKESKELGKPFRKGDRVPARLVAPGRYPQESFAVAEGRVITVQEPFVKEQEIAVRLTRDNHNVFYGRREKRKKKRKG